MYVQQFITIKVIYSFLDVLMFACFLVSSGYVVLNSECKSRVVGKFWQKWLFMMLLLLLFLSLMPQDVILQERKSCTWAQMHIYICLLVHAGGATAALVCVLRFTGKNLYGIS